MIHHLTTLALEALIWLSGWIVLEVGGLPELPDYVAFLIFAAPAIWRTGVLIGRLVKGVQEWTSATTAATAATTANTAAVTKLTRDIEAIQRRQLSHERNGRHLPVKRREGGA